MKNNFNGREAFVTLDDRSGRVDVRVSPSLLQEVEELVQKDLIWVVEGGIAYDDFNNGIKLRASTVSLLDDYRLHNGKALHLHLNGQSSDQIDSLVRELDAYKGVNAMPLIIHWQHNGYECLLKTNGQWSISPSEYCLLSLNKHFSNECYYVEY